MQNRGTLYAGTMLILLGIVFLLFTTADWLLVRMGIEFNAWRFWPLIILFLSAAFWAPIFIWWRQRTKVIGLAVPASIFLVLGLLFLYQSLSDDWRSWTYAWSLIPFSVGLGLFAMYALGQPETRSSGLLWSSVVVGAIGLFFQNDLHQNAPREIFASLGINHHARLVLHDQLLDFGQRDVTGRVRVVKTSIGVFLDNPLCRFSVCGGSILHEK